MRLIQLSMTNFPPFQDGEINFPSIELGEDASLATLAEVHLFTGENGSGKTRALAALMAAMGNLIPLQDRVREDSETEVAVLGESEESLAPPGHPCPKWEFKRGHENAAHPNFPMQRIASTFAMAGTGMALLEDAKVTPGVEMKPARANETLALSGQVGGGGIMQRLLNLRLFVALERDNNRNEESGRLAICLLRLEHAIEEISGRKFSLLVQSGRELRLKAKWGEDELFFPELPDGMRSLLNWLAGWVVLQAEYFDESPSPLDEEVILFLDEPENHLHPAWQRRVLPALQKLFKKAQIFVVSHSPFVVSSLNEGWIHKFTRGKNGLVSVEKAKKASRGDSYMTAVQEILDLSEWFDPETEAEIAMFERALDEAYTNNGQSAEILRQRAAKLSNRSQEVTTLVANLMAQFERSESKKTSKH